jgi:conflict system pore-forming effector with SLATT domain
VAAVAYQISFEPERPRLALFETVALVLLATAFIVGRRVRLHEAWIGYRSLAEAFRSSLFIAGIGSGDVSPDGAPARLRDEPWFQRAFTEAWGRRPAVFPERCDVAALREALVGSWIGDQIRYHRDAADRAERRHRLLTYAVEAMLLIAIFLSILHAFEAFGEKHPRAGDVLEFLAIALPGFSAALTGHRENRQYRLNAERSRRTADRLHRVETEMQAAPDLATVRRLAGEAQTIMVEENRDWFGVAELQELEVSL